MADRVEALQESLINTSYTMTTVKSSAASFIQLLAKSHDKNSVSLEAAYKTVAYMRAAVRYRGGAVSNIPFSIHTKTEGDISKDPIFESRAGLMTPDFPWFGKLQHLLFLTECSYALIGRAAWHLIPLREGNFTRLKTVNWLNPATITPKRNSRSELTGYERTGGKDDFSKEEVAFISPLDIFDEQYAAYGDGAAAKINAEIIANLHVFLSGHMKGGMLKNLLLLVAPGTSPEERALLKTWFKKRFSGARGDRFAVVKAGAITPITIGEGLDGLGNSSVERDQINAIAAAFRVPPDVLISDAANFATAKQHKLTMLAQVSIPNAGIHAAELNSQVFHPANLHFVFHFDQIEDLQTANAEQAALYAVAVEAGLMTPNEARAKLEGLEPHVDGDKLREPKPAVQKPATMSYEVTKELDRWKRKVKSDGKDIEFRANFISTEIQSVITKRIDDGEPLGAAFLPPFTNGRI